MHIHFKFKVNKKYNNYPSIINLLQTKTPSVSVQWSIFKIKKITWECIFHGLKDVQKVELRGSCTKFGIFFIIGPILLKLSSNM